MKRIVIINDAGETIADIQGDDVKVKRGFTVYIKDGSLSENGSLSEDVDNSKQ